MLRYHMAVLTKDTALKRAVRRLTTSTGATADFAAEPSALTNESPVNLYVLDVRGRDPDRGWLASCSPDARFIYIIDGDSVTDRINLLEDPRATSLFALDDRFDDSEFIAS